MRNLDISVLLKKSFQRTVKILFRPFVFKKWLYLILIACLAGNLGGGCNGGGPGGRYPHEKKAEAGLSQFPQSDLPAEDIVSAAPVTDLAAPSTHLGYDNPFSNWQSWPAWVYGLIVSGIIIILALMILFIWLGARFQFVWFNAIVQDDASVAKPFETFRTQGNSLFKLQSALLFISLVVLGGFAGWIIHTLMAQGVFQGNALRGIFYYFKIFLPPLLVFIVFIVLQLTFVHVVDHFVVPIMAMKSCLFREAWDRFFELYQKNAGEIWVYLFTRLGLGLVAGIMMAMVSIAVMFIMMIVGFIIGGIMYLILGVLLKVQVIFMVLLGILSIPFIISSILLMFMLGLPLAVFFRNFSLYYLSSLDGPYKPLALDDV